MYNIENDMENKRLVVTFKGFFSGEEGALFGRDFAKVIREIVPRDYILVLISKEMKAIKQENISDFRDSLKFYLAMGFKKYYMIPSDSLITLMQTKRVMKDIGFPGVFINSLDEAI